jgi:hypothetical protein
MRSIFALVLALVTAGSAWAADTSGTHNRYKWTDGDGNLHYSDALPPEAVKYGYEIVSPQGVIIKHVDRPKTADERATAKAELAKAQAAKDAAETRAHTDQQLIAAYPSEDDLKRAQHQQQDMLEQNLNSARTSLQSQERSLAELLGHAAELDSSGKAVPPALAKRIADSRKQVEDQRSYIARKETERDQTIAKFGDDLAHYRELKTPKDAAKQ